MFNTTAQGDFGRTSTLIHSNPHEALFVEYDGRVGIQNLKSDQVVYLLLGETFGGEGLALCEAYASSQGSLCMLRFKDLKDDDLQVTYEKNADIHHSGKSIHPNAPLYWGRITGSVVEVVGPLPTRALLEMFSAIASEAVEWLNPLCSHPFLTLPPFPAREESKED